MPAQRHGSGGSSDPKRAPVTPEAPARAETTCEQNAQPEPCQRRGESTFDTGFRPGPHRTSGDRPRRTRSDLRRVAGTAAREDSRPSVASRQQRPRIDVAEAAPGAPDPEMQAGVRVVDAQPAEQLASPHLLALTEARPDDRQVGDSPLAAGDGHHRPPGHHAGEGDFPGARRSHGIAGTGGEIDAAMRAGGVGVRARRITAHQLTVDRRPPGGLRGQRRRG